MTDESRFMREISRAKAEQTDRTEPADSPVSIGALLGRYGEVKIEATPDGGRVIIPAIRLADDCVIYPHGYTGPRHPDDHTDDGPDAA